MRKNGEWEDIEHIIKVKDHYTSSGLAISNQSYDWSHSIAETIYNIGGSRLNELLKIDVSPLILVELIKVCSCSNFVELSDVTILKYLHDKNNNLRKAITLKCLHSYSKSRLKLILKQYEESQETRYYNVIYWFDFGISMPAKTVKRALKDITY